MTDKIFNKTRLITLFFSLSLYLAYGFGPKNDPKPTNVIIIYMDDMGYGDLSAYGHPTIKTPNLDKLATHGQKWTNFYTASSVCSPSRGALLTGRYPIRIGLAGENKRVFFPESLGGLPDEEVTIAEILKKKGYATALIGKWHLGHLPQFLPDQQGFDEFYGLPFSNDMNPIESNGKHLMNPTDPKNWDIPLMHNEQVVERPVDQSTITKRYTEKTIEFITKHKDQPFFIYMAHSMVHVPLFASKYFLKSSERGLYGDVMNEVDWSVGAIVNTLKELNLEKNTLVVFTSDNGPWLTYREMGGSAGLLKNGKGTTWEGGMRVPGIFYMPGTVKPGLITDLGSTLDLLPTIAELTGAELPENTILDGFSLGNTLKEKTKSKRDHFIYYRKKEIYATRLGNYKAHFISEDCYKANNNRIDHQQPLLFELNHDPGEQYDQAQAKPEVLQEILTFTEKHRKSMKPKPSELDKWPN